VVISLKRIDANLLVSQGVFDFRLFRYGVAQESVERSWLSRLLGRGEHRFWIYREGKYKVGDEKPCCILFKYESVDGPRLKFSPPHFYKPGSYEVVYWNTMGKPVDLIERVKSKLDKKCLSDHTVFNTKDLGW
jgi:hypothetical protein